MRSHLESVLAVEARLRGVLSDADPAADLTRVAFAIAVDATECWLLLHLDPLRSKDTGCLEAAHRVLWRRGCPPRCGGCPDWSRAVGARLQGEQDGRWR